MVDDTVHLENMQGAQPALAAPAIRDHGDAGRFQGVQHGLVLRHVDHEIEPRDIDLERLRREAAAVAEGLEPQLLDRTAALLPGPLGRLQHADGTADVKLAAGRQPGDLGVEIHPAPGLVDEHLQPVADALPATRPPAPGRRRLRQA